MTNKTEFLSFDELSREMDGRWPHALAELAPSLAEAIGDAPNHVSCPVHGGRDGFRLYKDYIKTGGGVCNTCGPFPSGFLLLAWALNCTNKEAVHAVGRWHRNETTGPEPVHREPPPPPVPRIEPEVALARIRKAWLESRPLGGTPAEAYLAKRGIWRENMPDTLRYHPRMSWFDPVAKESLGLFPCLLAPIKQPDGQVASLHRIYLTPSGDKANVPDPKRMMAASADLRGSAIRLYPAQGEELGLAEGIETALAAHAISRMPVWACVTARLMETVRVPAHVKKVVIWADLDNSNTGAAAAAASAKRLREEGREVEILLPQGPVPAGRKSTDWLDVMLERGLEGFPPEYRRWRLVA